MLNVYKKYDNPKTLTGYKELRPVIVAINRLVKHPNRLKPGDKEILLANTHLKIFASEVELAVYFATGIIDKRVPDLEGVIAKDSHDAFVYARDVLKCRWADIGKPEVEQTIMVAINDAVMYAKDVIKGRWSDAEPYIMKNAYWSFMYARDVIKGRWSEAETTIERDSHYWGLYCNLFSITQ
jgi:hypothetical protein